MRALSEEFVATLTLVHDSVSSDKADHTTQIFPLEATLEGDISITSP